ncbi:acyl-CoA dehydrogenase family protein [Nocardioides sp. zg-1228]|uniref:acyl-CoA dehydrogenase family protein n=1 Tax=Nocardioides sp. zg-1228 TaxID=2763008 RepID=UPI001643393F|nr:acyl-CoA dehydrogenase [Nocardioides sp. zg-1228]MBC2934816.1 acyl-CoA dehydrogenase family protein [Nocardioides sp. zg-1228]QSF58393.1 acyl-CoA dehydrogenase family protein [Nocardioides sp. zg-1228]
MDFTYDDEQQALREAVRGLLATTYADHDRRRRTVAEEPGFDRGLWGRLAEMGILGLPFSETDGGVGAGPVEIGIVCQELGRVLAPEPYLSAVVHAGGLVAALGTADQKADLLGRLSAGELLLAAADTSPGDRWTSRADGVRASATDDGWTLDGVADPVMGGESADLLVVTAALPAGGTGAFLVEPSAATVSGYAAADLTRAATVRLDASAATPLGEPGRDVTASVATLSDLTRIMGANQALGVMQSQVRATTGYLKSRKQFGVTLNTFQALTFRAADMYVSLELAHSAVDWATMTIAGGDREAVADAADRVGLQVSRAARHIGQEAIQLHGGIAMTAEYAVGVGTAHLTVLEQWLGNAGHHLSRLSERVTDHDRVEALS